MLGERARARIDATTSTSFACDLKKWLQIMETYEGGGHAYHATLPTDALTVAARRDARDRAFGFDKVKAKQQELGAACVRCSKRAASSASPRPASRHPGVVVSYTDDAGYPERQEIHRAGPADRRRRAAAGDEPADFRSFRVGLFGLDKLQNVERTVQTPLRSKQRISAHHGSRRHGTRHRRPSLERHALQLQDHA
jgi:aspartate aminotransferase-like enzyme